MFCFPYSRMKLGRFEDLLELVGRKTEKKNARFQRV